MGGRDSISRFCFIVGVFNYFDLKILVGLPIVF